MYVSISGQGSISVRNKFVNLTISAAMWFNERQKILDEEILEESRYTITVCHLSKSNNYANK